MVKSRSPGHQLSSIQVKHKPTSGWFQGSHTSQVSTEEQVAASGGHILISSAWRPSTLSQLGISAIPGGRDFHLGLWGKYTFSPQPLKFIKPLTVKMYKALEMSFCVWLFCRFVWKQSYLWWKFNILIKLNLSCQNPVTYCPRGEVELNVIAMVKVLVLRQ